MENSTSTPITSSTPTPPDAKAEKVVGKPKFSLDAFPVGTLLRGRLSGFHKVCESNAWGKYTVKVADPEGIDIPKRVINGFSLKANFPKIPAPLWSCYMNLCFYLCPPGSKKLTRFDHDSQYEVQVCLLRDRATLTKWKMVVPKQVVSGVRVDADLTKCIDLQTGEEYTSFPPTGWVQAGTSHSHNTMPAFFSGTDDASELTNPGLHIVVGGIDHQKAEYEYEASIVQQKQRKTIDIVEVVDIEPVADTPFHEKVLSYISVVIEKNKQRAKEQEDEDRPRFRKSGPGFRIPGTIDLLDEDNKLNGFYRQLNSGNSDLFDDLDDEIDLGMLPEELRHAIMQEFIESGMDGDARGAE